MEKLDELVEDLADKMGYYGCGNGDGDHPSDCQCRICFVINMKDRILEVAKPELKGDILSEERKRIINYLRGKYGNVGRNASRTKAYKIAKDLALELELTDAGLI